MVHVVAVTKKGISIALLAILSISAYAENLAPSLCTTRNLQFIEIDNNDVSPLSQDFPNYTCNDFKAFDELAGRLKAYATGPLGPVSILATKTPTNNASFSFDWEHIFIGFHSANEAERANVLDVFAHEYGHAIFQGRLIQKIPILNELSAMKETYNNLWKFDFPVYSRLIQDPTCTQEDSECMKFITNFFKINESVRNALAPNPVTEEDIQNFLKVNHEELDFLNQVLANYHELFADSVAAVNAGDPDVIMHALRSLLGQDTFECRSFSISLKPTFKDADPHCSLSKIRADLWSKWIVPRVTKQGKVTTIKELADIMADQAVEAVRRTRDAGTSRIDPEVAEASLRKALGI